jgi:hypothetical protein
VSIDCGHTKLSERSVNVPSSKSVSIFFEAGENCSIEAYNKILSEYETVNVRGAGRRTVTLRTFAAFTVASSKQVTASVDI